MCELYVDVEINSDLKDLLYELGKLEYPIQLQHSAFVGCIEIHIFNVIPDPVILRKIKTIVRMYNCNYIVRKA